MSISKLILPIPYGKQNITDEDIRAVTEVLRSDFLTQGPKIKEFEEAFANYIGSRYAVAVANGTAALHLSALALGIKPGQKVITTPITFAASANCIRYCGGEVEFTDISPDTYLLDLEKVRTLLKSSPRGTYAGIILVDFGGYAVNLEAFRQLADQYGLWIIEDACHAPGGFFVDQKGRDQKCGNGNFAELAVFSFHPVKHITTGEGGMITTNSKELYEKLLELRTHGITRSPQSFKNSVSFASSELNGIEYPGWYMEMQSLGFNYRITDFQAALGLSQLQRADEGVSKRRTLAKRYDEAFENHPAITSQQNELHLKPSGHAYHLYVVLALDRMKLYNHLRANKIFCQIHYIPVHLMPYYRELGWNEGDLPSAEAYYSKCLSLPMYPTLSSEEQEYIIEKVHGFYSL
jgi:UDP-4-amino-4,6-dideoxy-N-acetyl-beta-L-altrosamine transaminase